MAEGNAELIERAVTALKNRDYKAFAACFSEDGRYYDYCPSSNGHDDWFVYGREAIEMFFRNRFVFDRFTLSEPLSVSDRRVTFFGAYDGPYLYAMFEITELGADGLIQKAVVHPTA